MNYIYNTFRFIEKGGIWLSFSFGLSCLEEEGSQASCLEPRVVTDHFFFDRNPGRVQK